MVRRRLVLVLIVALLEGGSLAWTGGYGLRLGSEAHRAEAEADISEFFGLPCDLGRVRGHTFESRAFEDVSIYLPERRDQVFHCKTAIWHEKEQEGRPWNELELQDGVLILGSDQWQLEDYRYIFESGAAYNLEDLQLYKVDLSDFEILFARRGVVVHCRHTAGTADLRDPHRGHAHLRAYELNGQAISQGVQIDAVFLPRSGLEVSEFSLVLPEVPLGTVGISSVLGGDVHSGRFAGQVQYRRTDQEPEIVLRGELIDADLTELTRSVLPVPLAGRLSVTLDRAQFSGHALTHFRGRGKLSDFALSPLASLLGRPQISGVASLSMDEADLRHGRIDRLRLDGRVDDVMLEEFAGLWGAGGATGKLSVRINNLNIVEDNIESADIELRAVPPAQGEGTIDRDLLLSVAENALDFTWPEALPREWLPKEVAYVELGMRLLVRDNQLRILGTHGREGDTILTIKVLGEPFGLIKEQPGTIDLGPHWEAVLNRLRSYEAERLPRWWRRGAFPASADDRSLNDRAEDGPAR